MLTPDGVIWMATEEGLHCLHKATGKWQHYYVAEEPRQGFRHLAQEGGRIFLGSLDHGLFYLERNQSEVRQYIKLDCPVVYDLSPDGKGNLYVGTDGCGVYKLDTKSDRISQQFNQASIASAISSNSVYSLLCDSRGQLWVGSYQNGVDYSLYQSHLIGTFSVPGFDTQNLAVRAFAKHGNQYMIGHRGGLYFVDTNRDIVLPMGPQQLNCQIVFSLCYLDGRFYVGTYGGGLLVFDPQSLKLQPFVSKSGSSLGEREIFCITLGPDSTLWVGAGGGVYHYGRNGTLLNHFDSKSSTLPKGNVYEIYFDSNRRGWVCTENGMCVYDELSNSLRTDIFMDGFVHKQKIRDVFEDSHHRLFFLPDPGDISAWNLSLQPVDSAELSLPPISDGMFAIENPAGKLWVGTKSGLYSFGTTTQVYNFADGLNNTAFTFCQPIIDENGRLWMGSEAGLLYVDEKPDSAVASAAQTRYVTGLLLDGERMSLSLAELFGNARIKLKSKPRDITFLLSELSFTRDNAMRYEYKLDDVDNEWHQLTGVSEITYRTLGWGRWTFRVRNSANPSEECEFKIRVPMSKSDIVELCLAILFVLSIIALMVWFYLNKRFIKRLLDIVKREFRGSKHIVGAEEPTDLNSEETESEPEEPDEMSLAFKHGDKDKYRNVNISEAECVQLADALATQMREQKLYKNPDLKIADVAEAVGTTPYMMSYLLSQYLNVSYYDYVNEFRVEEFKSLVTHVDLNLYTLPALGEQCGFSSRAAFFRNFKKVTGVTPNEYVQSLQK